MGQFPVFKLWLVDATGLPQDALHVYLGLIIFLGFAAVFRLSLRDWRPITAVLLAVLAGEAWDLADMYRTGEAPRWGMSGHDVWNTMFWPLVLFILARWSGVLKR